MSAEPAIPDRMALDALAYGSLPGGLDEARGLRILIHVGLHKTGTTWFQRQFMTAGTGFIPVEDFRTTHAAFLVPEYGSFSLSAVAELFGPILARARAADLPVIISDEALAGRPFHQRFFRGIVACRLRAAFPQAAILVTVREQAALINSIYGEYLRYGYTSSLPAFLAGATRDPNVPPLLDFGFYDYDRLLDFYEAMFGTGRAVIAPMEWMLSDTDAFARRLGTVLGAPVAPGAARADRVERAASSTWARTAQRQMNKLHPQDSRAIRRAGRFSPHAVAYWVNRLTPPRARRRGETAALDAVRQALGQRYAESNDRVGPRIGLDLGRFGYAMPENTRTAGIPS